jgi:hypothetical protein
MSRSDRLILASFIGVLIAAVVIGIALYPEKPRLSGNTAHEEISTSHRAGSSDCQPYRIGGLSGGKSSRHRESCERAEREQTNNRNNYIQARRSADAADASAVAAYEQARVSAIGAALGIITMFAAIGAAFYAREAARHTDRGAKEAARAATANEESVRAARETSQNESRAYMSFLESNFNFSVDADRIKVTASFVNSGQTPAYDLQIDGYLFSIKVDAPWVKRKITFKDKPSGIYGPTQKVIDHWEMENGATTFNQLRGLTHKVYLVGKIRYRDIYRQYYFLQFVLESQSIGSGISMGMFKWENYEKELRDGETDTNSTFIIRTPIKVM